jgi:putative hydrolase of the HAD superfamily
LRKPEVEIFQLALDIAQVKPDRVVYIENTQMFVDIAQNLGIRTVLHTDYESTCSKLESFGLSLGQLQPLKKSKL